MKLTKERTSKNVWMAAIVVAGLSFALLSGATLQQAFGHANTTLTLDEDPVDGKKIRVTVGHTNEPSYGAKPGVHDGKHSFEVSLADSDTRMPLSGASLKADKYYFKDIKAFNKAKSLKDANDVEKGISVGAVFGDPGHYLARQVQKDGIYGYRLYGTISYFGEASIDIDATVFCTTPDGDTKKFNKGSWSGSFGCTEDIDDALFPSKNADVNPSSNRASYKMDVESGQIQQAASDSGNAAQTTLNALAVSPTSNGAAMQQASSTVGLQLLMFGLPVAAVASYFGIRTFRNHRQRESI
jgi:hypothetical protein